MNNIKKNWGLILFFFLVAIIPLKADARTAESFKAHCSQNLQFNDFASITSIPPALNTPLTQADDGGWVAIYEIDTENENTSSEELLIEVAGSVNKNNAYATICINGLVLGVVPTYQISPTDTDSYFKIQYTLELKSGEESGVKAINPIVFSSNSDFASVNKVNDWNDADLAFIELEEVQADLIPSFSDDFEKIAGGYAYHEVYATYSPQDLAVKKKAFTMEAFDRITSFNYAIFPPLETLSGCNASSLANLSVEDIKCFPAKRQEEFKKYFLGLPEVIQRLFDFAADVEDEPASIDGSRELIVNYFNEKSGSLESAPTTGEWLSISEEDKKYRYFPIKSIEIDSDLSNGLESYYDMCDPSLPASEFNGCYSGIHGCNVNNNLDIIAEVGQSMVVGQGICSGENLPADTASLLSHVGINDPNDPKIVALANMNAEANKICREINDSGSISKLQAINASSVAITQYLADLDSRYEGFNACEKISAINTLSGLMDRTLEVLGRSSQN